MIGLLLLPLPVLAISLLIGPSSAVSNQAIIKTGLAWLLGFFPDAPPAFPDASLVATIILEVRLPRILMAFLVGGALSISGVTLQTLFRNPLVCPYILGLSAGAAFGAALAVAMGWGAIQLSAFSGGALAVTVSYAMARSRGQISMISLILSGVMVTGIFTALLTLVQFMADPFKLQTIVHWTMGNLHTASWAKLSSATPPIAVSTLYLLLYRWRLNVLAMGEEETRAVGLNPELEPLRFLVPATLAASAAVAVAGIIGLIGLMVPHMVRILVGPDNTRSVPVCFTLGGCLTVVVDDLCRSLMLFEIPVGVLTSLVGGPVFILLLKKSRAEWDL